MSHFHHCAGGLLIVSLAALVGCGGGEDDPTVPVSGTVTLDGEPIPEANITFLPADGKGATAGAQVKEGKYETRVEPGPKKVSIEARREDKNSTAPPDPHAGPPMEQYLPAKYNSRTTLQTEIPAEGAEDINFELTSGQG